MGQLIAFTLTAALLLAASVVPSDAMSGPTSASEIAVTSGTITVRNASCRS